MCERTHRESVQARGPLAAWHIVSLSGYIKDTTHMLRTLQQWNHDYGPFGDGVRLVTIDVIRLYTNLQQIFGTAIGTPMAPSAPNLFMG